MRLSTKDLHESVQAVSGVYCAHELQLDPRSKSLHTQLSTKGQWAQSMGLCTVDLAYGAKVKVDAGRFPNLYLFMHCQSGRGIVTQHHNKMAWLPGSTLPVSANLRTRFDFEEQFAQTSFPVDGAYLNGLCSRLLGYRPDQEVRFDLTPFPHSMAATWRHLMGLIQSLPSDLPPAAQSSLREHVVTLLLTQLAHNLSDALTQPHQGKGQRTSVQLVLQAHDYIQAHLDNPELVVSDVAQAIGVSVRVLQYAFRKHKRTTPQAHLRECRLEQAHTQLMNLATKPGARASLGEDQPVGRIAMDCGFFHLGRFAQYYKQKYGMLPSQTVRLALQG